MQKILKYNQNHLKYLLNQGKISIVFAIIILIINNLIEYNLLSISIYIFVMVVYYIIAYFYKKSKGYLTIEGDFIKKNIFFGGAVNLKEIVDIQKFHDEYYFVTTSKKFYINSALLDEEGKKIILEIIDNIIKE
jgi:hypothetical protein